MMDPVILGTHQTDFAVNWARNSGTIYDILAAAVLGAIADADLEPADIETAHIGNFAGELFTGQGHLGGLFATIDPALSGVPASRHEAACASGSMAILAATAELEAKRYDVACVVGVEQMKNVSTSEAAAHLGSALWVGEEANGVEFPWPHQFSTIADEYADRYCLEYDHLMLIAQKAFDNAKRNDNAQTRTWVFEDDAFTADDDLNPVVDGRIRKQDCARITDGAAAVILATPSYATRYAARRNLDVARLPRITGWGHATAQMRLDHKLAASREQPFVFPHVRSTITDAWRRAGIADVGDVDVIETHDCFTITEYMAIDHFGITAPGRSWQALEAGTTMPDGELPINPSGGLIGAGHPVGATGVRMLVDAAHQVTDRAAGFQVAGARRAQTLNIGGSATTVASFIVET